MSERMMFSTRIRADSSFPCYLIWYPGQILPLVVIVVKSGGQNVEFIATPQVVAPLRGAAVWLQPCLFVGPFVAGWLTAWAALWSWTVVIRISILCRKIDLQLMVVTLPQSTTRAPWWDYSAVYPQSGGVGLIECHRQRESSRTAPLRFTTPPTINIITFLLHTEVLRVACYVGTHNSKFMRKKSDIVSWIIGDI